MKTNNFCILPLTACCFISGHRLLLQLTHLRPIPTMCMAWHRLPFLSSLLAVIQPHLALSHLLCWNHPGLSTCLQAQQIFQKYPQTTFQKISISCQFTKEPAPAPQRPTHVVMKFNLYLSEFLSQWKIDLELLLLEEVFWCMCVN